MTICRICENNSVHELFNFGQQPIVNDLNNKINDEFKTYSFILGSCENCGFVQLINCIDQKILYINYFTLSSWKNQPHVSRIIDVIKNLSSIKKDSTIIDIGSNDGSFLEELNKNNFINIEGIEPTKDSYESSILKNLKVENCFFNFENAKKLYENKKFDFIVTRHVLEHIVDLDDFLSAINFIMKDDGMLFIEIPESENTFLNLDYSLWEETVNYFTINTIKQLLQKHQLDILHYETTLFSGKSMMIYCKRNTAAVPKYNNSDRKMISNYHNKRKIFQKSLISFLDNLNKPILIYGSGCRSSNFVNFNNISNKIIFFVDDQVEKQNKFVPGCNLEIISWKEKFKDNFVVFLGVNTENENIVINKRKLSNKNTFSILPPSNLLPSFWRKLIFNN